MAVCFAFYGFLRLNGAPPRSDMETYFQSVIDRAQISDKYLNPGWDSEDVTGKICDRVNPAELTSLDLPVGVDISKQNSDIWTINEEKSLLAACADHTQRYLKIAIDRETSACSAVVSVFPTCDP